MQEIRHDGSRGPVELFDQKKMMEALNKSTVKEVRVFTLNVGQRVTIEGEVYEVKKVQSRGRIQLKHIGEVTENDT